MIGTKVLLVDDEKVFTDNMSRLLEARGYVVTVAGNGERAVRALQGAGYDVVVLDLKMPGKDGLATLEEIKRLGLLTETLILTGHGSIDRAGGAEARGLRLPDQAVRGRRSGGEDRGGVEEKGRGADEGA